MEQSYPQILSEISECCSYMITCLLRLAIERSSRTVDVTMGAHFATLCLVEFLFRFFYTSRASFSSFNMQCLQKKEKTPFILSLMSYFQFMMSFFFLCCLSDSV